MTACGRVARSAADSEALVLLVLELSVILLDAQLLQGSQRACCQERFCRPAPQALQLPLIPLRQLDVAGQPPRYAAGPHHTARPAVPVTPEIITILQAVLMLRLANPL